MEGLLLFGAYGLTFIQYHAYTHLCQPPELIYSQANPLAQRVAAHSVFKSVFYPHPLFFNRHVSLVPFILKGVVLKLFPPYRYFSMDFQLADGEVIIVDWVISPKIGTGGFVASDDATPIVMIHPGLGGDSTDIPGQSYIQGGLDRGWIVCVFNRRGHRRALSVPRWNLFGSTSDVREVVQHIAQIRPNAPLLNVGLSIGSGLLVRYFGETDNLFTAGAAVCPGYDISVCMSRVQQPYQSVLLASVKSFFLNRNSGLLSAIPGFEDCLRARTVQELLDKAYTMAGFATSDEYYEHCNPMVVARDITKPVLVINARDDPICVERNVLENKTLFLDSNTHAILAMTASGSHLPFYMHPRSLICSLESWAEEAAYVFFDLVLEGEGEEVANLK